MAARNGKCFHTVERHGKGIAHANHLPTVWGQCPRSEEHTSELQSQSNFVCRLLLEKKNLSLFSSSPSIPRPPNTLRTAMLYRLIRYSASAAIVGASNRTVMKTTSSNTAWTLLMRIA